MGQYEDVVDQKGRWVSWGNLEDMWGDGDLFEGFGFRL